MVSIHRPLGYEPNTLTAAPPSYTTHEDTLKSPFYKYNTRTYGLLKMMSKARHFLLTSLNRSCGEMVNQALGEWLGLGLVLGC